MKPNLLKLNDNFTKHYCSAPYEGIVLRKVLLTPQN